MAFSIDAVDLFAFSDAEDPALDEEVKTIAQWFLTVAITLILCLEKYFLLRLQ